MNKQSEAQARSDRKNVVPVYIKLSRSTDADIIEYLEGKNKQGAIKEALRKVIQSSL